MEMDVLEFLPFRSLQKSLELLKTERNLSELLKNVLRKEMII